MAHVITLTDGVTTADLYTLTATFVMGDGWNLAGGGSEPQVGEVLELLLQGASVASLQGTIATIERLLTAARSRYGTGVGERVFLTVQFDGEASSWRSEILDGRLDMRDAPDRLHTRKLKATLALSRWNYWEGVEVELPLSANGQAAATGGRTVTNGVASWLQIAAAQVAGSLPSPLRLELTAAADRGYTAVHVGLNSDADPATFPHILEGESATSGGTTTAVGSASGGNVRRVTVNPSATMLLPITAAMAQAAAGAPFLLLCRVAALSGLVTVRPELRATSGVTVWRAHQPMAWTRTTPHLAVLGTLPIPPLGWDAAVHGAITLALVFEAASTQTVDVDFLAFLPANAGNYRLLTMFGATVSSGHTIVDNGVDRWAGVRVSGVIQPTVSPRGSAIFLKPNTLQRLYILAEEDDTSLVTDTFTARAYYRPRRLTL